MATGDSGDFVPIATVDSGQCGFEAAGLQNGEKYRFRLKARNQSGTSSGVALQDPVVASPLGKEGSCLFLWRR